MTTTFDFPTPDWVIEPAESAIDIETLGALAGTLSDVIAALQQSGLQSLPRRSADGAEFGMWELMFLQRYPFTHMLLMRKAVRDELAEMGIPPWFVTVHTQWERTIAEVLHNMAHQVQVRGVAYPEPFGSAEAWIEHLEYLASMATHLAQYTDEDAADADAVS